MGNSSSSVLPNTRAWEQQERNKIMKQTRKVRREAGVQKEASRHEKKSPDGLSHPNQNIIKINTLL